MMLLACDFDNDDPKCHTFGYLLNCCIVICKKHYLSLCIKFFIELSFKAIYKGVKIAN